MGGKPAVIELHDQARKLIAEQRAIAVHANCLTGLHSLGGYSYLVEKWLTQQLAHATQYALSQTGRNLIRHSTQGARVESAVSLVPAFVRIPHVLDRLKIASSQCFAALDEIERELMARWGEQRHGVGGARRTPMLDGLRQWVGRGLTPRPESEDFLRTTEKQRSSLGEQLPSKGSSVTPTGLEPVLPA